MTVEDMKELVRSHELTAVVVLQDGILQPSPGKEANRFEVFVRPGLSARHLEIIDDLISDAVVETRVVATGMKFEELRTMMRAPRSDTMRLQEGGGEAIEYEWAKRLIPMAFMFLVWIATFSSGNYLLTSTIEEKSNRIIEVLLSSLTTNQLLMGKVFGVAAVGITMQIAWIGSLIGILNLKAGPSATWIADLIAAVITPELLLGFVFYFIAGYFFYAFLFAGIGSICNTIKEAQNFMSPLMLLMMVPLATMTFIPSEPNGTIATTLSWIPRFFDMTSIKESFLRPVSTSCLTARVSPKTFMTQKSINNSLD